MRFLLYILVFIGGGVIGFFIGGGGAVATGVTGTALGACSAAKVAVQQGMLTADQQTALLAQTSSYLRSEFPKLTKQLGLENQPPLSPERCADVATQIDVLKQKVQ